MIMMNLFDSEGQSPYNKLPSKQKSTFRTATVPKLTNQQNHKANAYITIVQGYPNKTSG
jgi:hypothetical protein